MNENTYKKKDLSVVVVNNSAYTLVKLNPTEKSQAAYKYFLHRKAIARDGWALDAVVKLKAAFDEPKKPDYLWNEMPRCDAKDPSKAESGKSDIVKRIQDLLSIMEKSPELFDPSKKVESPKKDKK